MRTHKEYFIAKKELNSYPYSGACELGFYHNAAQRLLPLDQYLPLATMAHRLYRTFHVLQLPDNRQGALVCRCCFNTTRSATTTTTVNKSSTSISQRDNQAGAGSSLHSNSKYDKPSQLREVPYKRMRQHINPFAGKLATLMPTEEQLSWADRVARHEQPFHLDLGCAAGSYLFSLARKMPHMNFIGLEIRKHLVDVASYRQARDGVDNLAFLHCNLLSPGALDAVLSSLKKNVRSVSIFHPDPNFKKKRKKRNVVTPRLLSSLSKGLPHGAHLYIQSDVHELFLEMDKTIRANHQFRKLPDEVLGEGFNSEKDNAMGMRTDRENSVLRRNLNVWRENYVLREAPA